jgi:hypothetical protein
MFRANVLKRNEALEHFEHFGGSNRVIRYCVHFQTCFLSAGRPMRSLGGNKGVFHDV